MPPEDLCISSQADGSIKKQNLQKMAARCLHSPLWGAVEQTQDRRSALVNNQGLCDILMNDKMRGS